MRRTSNTITAPRGRKVKENFKNNVVVESLGLGSINSKKGNT